MTMKTNITKFCARAAATLAFPLKRLPVALLMMLTTATAWADGISYLDATGTQQSCTTYTTVESSSTSWNSGWCVVNSNTTISDRITVSGTVNLILCDGATLTASKGITVGSDATLNIYAQTDDEATMGALVADATNDNMNWYAGIGGVENADAGTITINGGKINAIGFVGAGIGSGGGTSTVGTITINGGIVTAHDSQSYGAGIGGGFSGGKAGTINLNGGVINAAGIGSGYMGGDCSITVNISDGVKKIVATPVQGGACIGKGKSASGSVTVNFISGGNIVTGDAKDAVFYDTGEGAQRQVRAKAMNHAVTMSDDLKANITATSEYAFAGETVTLTLGTAVDATTLSVNGGAVATTDAGNRQYTFTMPDGDVTVTATLLQTYAVSLPANMEVVSATNAADADGKYITGTTVTFKASFPYAASNVSDGTSTLEPDANGIYTVTVADADVTITATVERSATIDLTDAPGDFNAIEGDVLTGTTSHTVTIADGAGITLSGATISGGIVCEGTATITLVGTNSVSVVPYNKAGIQIGGSGTTLTITGDGSLTANGGAQSAGIGLSRAWNPDGDVIGGDIVIEGGNITANGGSQWGAGIGTGVIYGNGNAKTARIGNITIEGGTVKATGGSEADGIGTGYTYNPCTNAIGTVTIYDGIDLVDASSIKDFANVVYMHVDGETETDVTANKTDNFTIIENGDRRIIVQKVNPTIAEIPDQTYTGSAITPEPTVVAGSLSLTKGTDYTYSYTDNTNVGTATVRATFQGDYASLGYVERTFTIMPSTIMVSVTGGGTVTIGDKSASDGEAFGVMSAKGASVVLTLAPKSGNAVRSVEYGYTNSVGTTVSGRKLPITGGTATLTVPTDLKDGTGVTLTVTFAAALVGGTDEASAVALTDATVTDLAGGWYKVESDITFDHTLNLLGDTHLTIAEGATMTVTPTTGKGIDSDYTLNVSGAGTLNVTGTGEYSIAIRVGNYVQTGAVVTASGFIGIRCYDGFDADVTNDFTFSGGQLTVTGTSDGIRADNTITLSCTNGSDFIKSSSYDVLSGGTIKVADGKALTDGNGNILTGTLAAADVNGKTLAPFTEVTLADNADNSAVISQLNNVTDLAVTLQGRTINKDKWNTLCLPFDIDTPAAVFGTGVKVKTLSDYINDGTTVTIAYADADQMTAGTPYIVMLPEGAESMANPVFSGVTIDKTLRDVVAGGATFKGTYAPVALTANDRTKLFLANNTLWYPNADVTVKACRAYFDLTTDVPTTANDAPSIVIDYGNGETTEITTTDLTDYTDVDEAWYTLDGRKLQGQPTQKGLYIYKGRKVKK